MAMKSSAPWEHPDVSIHLFGVSHLEQQISSFERMFEGIWSPAQRNIEALVFDLN